MNDRVPSIIFVIVLILLDRVEVMISLTWLVRGIAISLLKVRRT